MNRIWIFSLALVLFSMISCDKKDPNIGKDGEDEFKSLEIEGEINKDEMTFQDVIYVPIYSDVYLDVQNEKALLSATLSIRNTSYDDSLFISKIDYFNTDGNLVRSYIKHAISLPPMGTVNYVIEKEDDTGGPGANFIVALNAKSRNVRPLIQAIMIGTIGNKAFAFSTDGYSVKSKKAVKNKKTVRK